MGGRADVGTNPLRVVFDACDNLTDNQLRIVAGYARDLLQDRRQERAMAHRQAQNAPDPTVAQSEAAAERKKPAERQA